MTVTTHEGLTYCSHRGADLKGDLFLPQGTGPFPILIGAPGGAWRVCVRASLAQWGHYLASRGYGFFSIDYRVATKDRKAFPEAVQDIFSAVRFVRGSAAQYGIDPQRIGLLGVSAGAHLAAVAALAHDPATEVKTLVALYGIYDLFKHWQDDLALNPGTEGNIARNLIGADPFEEPAAYFNASPLHLITYRRNRMPVLVSWGTADEFVNPAQSEAFVRALQQARFNVRTHRAVGASHFWFQQALDDPRSESALFAPRLMQFLGTSL